MNDDGTMTSDAQRAYALALQLDLLTDPAQRGGAASRLAQLVRDAGNRIATGFVGTPLVSDALSGNGMCRRHTTCCSSANARHGCGMRMSPTGIRTA